ncbi:MAG: hypothetical protein EWV76_14500 [Microcystis novacekii Mn_MB_F_20050700_S1]|uniref:Uncharacterized protein n=1 Tax=Microcystis novacekii Mn_MB_F_20050700_S1D TaxID=2486266 RepID=A0A552IYB9_9CHRO|nr:MAG: hypothetical protein EWV76_14500 [Microcystis novacekii Mn_MB_F_20050700_S1]TRU88461.1 MAG: hypothetical protein EWV54_10575 [Microcystis novacekii Mn_MB_F_20050700_S1D]
MDSAILQRVINCTGSGVWGVGCGVWGVGRWGSGETTSCALRGGMRRINKNNLLILNPVIKN